MLLMEKNTEEQRRREWKQPVRLLNA